ncbi:HU family DNA-binding protein [Oceanispirochaeta sp.]|jgi:DNA-binding protein HU-beta|uniref:HU family DNA-binding protein n=1 Tax=Oceanispirochaeta sp. TaxID=2035350 RepID=UPI00261C6252|nr:HU family DNA-binding protein [Oceanispirochaeta sp.]MDA3958926.1 HU family DNA-binding protein [Oceanispirochaeta sp.]
MNKQELVKELSQSLDMPQKDIRDVLNAFMEEIVLVMEEGERYNQTGFGTFKTEIANERISYNPSLRKKMKLPPKRKVKFRPSAKFKEKINE